MIGIWEILQSVVLSWIKNQFYCGDNLYFYEDLSNIIIAWKGTDTTELTDTRTEKLQHNIILVHGSAVNHSQKNTEPTLARTFPTFSQQSEE